MPFAIGDPLEPSLYL